MNALILMIALGAWYDRPNHINYLQDHQNQAYVTLLTANTLIGCFSGGLGSVYNDGSFGNGCLKGAFGSFVAFEGKMFASRAGYYPGLGALGKIFGNVGNSIVQSAVENKPFDSVYFDLGPIGLTLGREAGLSYTLYPVIAMVHFASKGGKFDWKKSVYNLTPTFAMDNMVEDVNGWALSNVIAYYKPGKFDDIIISHEMVHVLQWSGLQPFNTFKWGRYNIGQDAAYCVLRGVFGTIKGIYYYDPFEIEAYSLVKD